LHAHALEIEAAAKPRLAYDYDAAQARGEVASSGQRGPTKAVDDSNSFSPATAIGGTHPTVIFNDQVASAHRAQAHALKIEVAAKRHPAKNYEAAHARAKQRWHLTKARIALATPTRLQRRPTFAFAVIELTKFAGLTLPTPLVPVPNPCN